MGLLGFSRRKYEDLFGVILRKIETSKGVALPVHPSAVAAIVGVQLENARMMKRSGSGARSLSGDPIEHSLVRTSALLTAYILAGTKVVPAREAESTPFADSISRDIGPALIAHDPSLSSEARMRIERIVNQSAVGDEALDLEDPIDARHHSTATRESQRTFISRSTTSISLESTTM